MSLFLRFVAGCVLAGLMSLPAVLAHTSPEQPSFAWSEAFGPEGEISEVLELADGRILAVGRSAPRGSGSEVDLDAEGKPTVWITDERGAVWAPSVLGEEPGGAADVIETSAGRVVIGGHAGGRPVVWISRDSASWDSVDLPAASDAATDEGGEVQALVETDHGTLVAGGSQTGPAGSAVIWLSADGDGWAPVTDPALSDGARVAGIDAFALTRDDTLVAVGHCDTSCASGVWSSRDGGRTWADRGEVSETESGYGLSLRATSLLETDDGRLVAVGSLEGYLSGPADVFSRSRDGSWSAQTACCAEFDSSLLTDIDEFGGGYLASGGDLYWSVDLREWTKLAEVSDSGRVTSVERLRDGRVIAAGRWSVARSQREDRIPIWVGTRAEESRPAPDPPPRPVEERPSPPLNYPEVNAFPPSGGALLTAYRFTWGFVTTPPEIRLLSTLHPDGRVDRWTDEGVETATALTPEEVSAVIARYREIAAEYEESLPHLCAPSHGYAVVPSADSGLPGGIVSNCPYLFWFGGDFDWRQL